MSTNENYVPSTSHNSSNEDFRINCSSTQVLQSIIDTVSEHLPELVDSVELTEEKEAFKLLFFGIFKSALEENVTVNGLPWRSDKTSLTASEKEDEQIYHSEVFISRLSKIIGDVAQKRKNFPVQCRKILSMKYKHAFENLKKSKIRLPEKVRKVPHHNLSSTVKDVKKVGKVLKFVEEMGPKVLAQTKQEIEELQMATSMCQQRERLIEASRIQEITIIEEI